MSTIIFQSIFFNFRDYFKLSGKVYLYYYFFVILIDSAKASDDFDGNFYFCPLNCIDLSEVLYLEFFHMIFTFVDDLQNCSSLFLVILSTGSVRVITLIVLSSPQADCFRLLIQF